MNKSSKTWMESVLSQVCNFPYTFLCRRGVLGRLSALGELERGDLVDDECGVCNGGGPEAGLNCEGVPLDFTWDQSTLQAFYYFYTVTINGDSVNADDWVG